MVPLAYLYGVSGQIIVFGLIVISALIWRIRRGTDGYVRTSPPPSSRLPTCRSCSASP